MKIRSYQQGRKSRHGSRSRSRREWWSKVSLRKPAASGFLLLLLLLLLPAIASGRLADYRRAAGSRGGKVSLRKCGAANEATAVTGYTCLSLFSPNHTSLPILQPTMTTDQNPPHFRKSTPKLPLLCSPPQFLNPLTLLVLSSAVAVGSEQRPILFYIILSPPNLQTSSHCQQGLMKCFIVLLLFSTSLFFSSTVTKMWKLK